MARPDQVMKGAGQATAAGAVFGAGAGVSAAGRG